MVHIDLQMKEKYYEMDALFNKNFIHFRGQPLSDIKTGEIFFLE
jgi:hypothetical protein